MSDFEIHHLDRDANETACGTVDWDAASTKWADVSCRICLANQPEHAHQDHGLPTPRQMIMALADELPRRLQAIAEIGYEAEHLQLKDDPVFQRIWKLASLVVLVGHPGVTHQGSLEIADALVAGQRFMAAFDAYSTAAQGHAAQLWDRLQLARSEFEAAMKMTRIQSPDRRREGSRE